MQAIPMSSDVSVDSLYTAFVRSYDAHFIFPGESHDMWELDYIISGQAGITSGANVYRCTEGTLFIHAPGVFHTFWTEAHTDVRCLTVTFTGEGLDRYACYGKFLLSGKEQRIASVLADEISRLCEEGSLQGEISDGDCTRTQTTLSAPWQIVKKLLEALFLYMSCHESEHAVCTHEREDEFSRIVLYMEHHVCDALDIQRICLDTHMGRSALKQLFQRYAGIGVMQYFLHLRVRYAEKRILQGASMSEIAREMNFSSQNYFSAFFKRMTGVSPLQYRKAHIAEPRK